MAITFEALSGLLEMRTEGWESGLKRGDEALGKFAGSATNRFSALTAAAERTFGGIQNLIVNAFAVGAVVSFVKSSVAAFVEAERAELRLKAAIEATGGAAGLTMGQMKTLAKEVHDLTIFEDDAAISAMSLLTSMKEIKGDNFKEVVRVAADMATVLGGDLQSAVESVGKALADPERGLSLLRRQGVAFTDEQVELVKKLNDSGQAMQAQKVILDELKSRYQGAAAEIKNSMGGAIEDLKKRWSDVKENVGQQIAPAARDLVSTTTGVVEAGGSIFSKTIDGFSLALAQLKGDLDMADAISRRLEAGRKEADAQWAERSGKIEEARRLREEAQSLRWQSENISSGGKAALSRDPAKVKPVGSGGAANPTAAMPAHANKPATEDPNDPFFGVSDRFNARNQQAAFNAGALREASPEAAAKLVGGIKDEFNSAIEKGGLRYTVNNGAVAVDTAGFEKIMAVYRSRAELMQGFNAEQWTAMERRAVGALRMATASSGEMRAFYIDSLEGILKTGEKMFEDVAKKADAVKAKAADVRAEVGQGGGRNASPIGVAAPGKRDATEAAKTPSEFDLMQNESRNALQFRLADMAKQFRNSDSLNASLGIGTPEQRRDLVELGKQVQDVMRQVRDSTGEARAANIEELKTITDAYAKAYAEIRAGSKETAKQLAADAKAQAAAARKAAAEAANPTGDVFNMSKQLGSAMTGAFAGRHLGAGAAGMAEVMAAATARQRLDLAIQAKSAEVGMANLNISGLSGGRGGALESMNSLQRELASLQARRAEMIRKEAEERQAAEDRQQENYRRKKAQEAELERQRAASVTTTGGVSVTMNLHGVTDTREMVDKLDKELKRRGYSADPRARIGK